MYSNLENPNTPSMYLKTNDSERLQKEVEEFIKNGGKIIEIGNNLDMVKIKNFEKIESIIEVSNNKDKVKNIANHQRMMLNRYKSIFKVKRGVWLKLVERSGAKLKSNEISNCAQGKNYIKDLKQWLMIEDYIISAIGAEK